MTNTEKPEPLSAEDALRYTSTAWVTVMGPGDGTDVIVMVGDVLATIDALRARLEESIPDEDYNRLAKLTEQLQTRLADVEAERDETIAQLAAQMEVLRGAARALVDCDLPMPADWAQRNTLRNALATLDTPTAGAEALRQDRERVWEEGAHYVDEEHGGTDPGRWDDCNPYAPDGG